MKMIRVTISIAIGVLSTCVLAAGQQDDVGTPGSIKKPPQPTTTPPIIVKPSKAKPVTRTTGRLFVVAEPNANLRLEPIGGGNDKAKAGTVPLGKRDFIFNDLKPRRYRVVGTLEGYYPEETNVTIEANKVQSVILSFRRVLYLVTIRTNVDNGLLKYTRETESALTVMEIQGKSVQLSLPAGRYSAELSSNEFGYETLHESFSVTQQAELNFPLRRIAISTETFSPTWTPAELKEWDVPSTWEVDSKRLLLLKGPGVGLPRAPRYRLYKDFKLDTSVKMNKPVSVSFALRAQDSLNHYLLQLTGDNSDDPYMVRLFVVKDGNARRVQAVSLPRSAVPGISSGESFGVLIEMIGFEIKVSVENTTTGAVRSLSTLSDQDRTFQAGAIGIVCRPGEDNIIERFVVCSKSCLNN